MKVNNNEKAGFSGIFNSFKEREIYKNWKSTFFLFIILCIIFFINVFLRDMIVDILAMGLYALFTFIFIKRGDWKEIRIKKPKYNKFFLIGLILITLEFIIGYLIRYLLFDFNSLNFFALMGEQQLQYGVITKYNAWQYFPIAVIGFCTISPFTEEFFFRGALMKSFEYKTSPLKANIIQSYCFSFVHVFYFWMINFNIWLILIFPIDIWSGFLFGWAAQKIDSIYVPIIMHMIHNFLAILFIYTFIIPVIG